MVRLPFPWDALALIALTVAAGLAVRVLTPAHPGAALFAFCGCLGAFLAVYSHATRGSR